MANTNLKGITVQIGGDTTNLNSALKSVNSEIYTTQSNLTAVNRALKFDPTNVELLTQKQKVLSTQIENTKAKLQQLEDVQAQVEEQFERGNLGVDEHQAFQIEVASTKSRLSDLENQLKQTTEQIDNGGASTEDLTEKTKKASDGFTVWKGALANLVAEGIKIAISAVKELISSTVELGQEFSSTMSEVSAISGASDEELAQLEETARQFGATTVFSASQSAEALKYMSLAGWSAEQSTSALGGVLDLAAASGMELGTASDMVTDYMSAFGMSAEKSAYFADLLSFAQANSNTTVTDLGEAFRNCAANLNATGQDVETVTSFLEGMANQGYKGSEAGTVLTATMRDMTNSMKLYGDAAELANLSSEGVTSATGNLNDILNTNAIQIGNVLIPVSDLNGNYRDLTDILADVESATSVMGDAERAAALSSVFTANSIKGVNLILNEGVESVAGYEEALRGSNGAASDMANTMNDNLSGDLASLNSAVEEVKLQFYDMFENYLRTGVEFLTNNVVPAISTVIDNMDIILPIIAGLTTSIAVLKTTMAISGVINAVTAAWTAYKAANEGATIAQWLFNAALNANPIVLIVSLIAGLVVAFIALWNTSDEFREFWINLWETVKSAVSTAFTAVVGFFQNIWTSITTFFSNIWTSITSFFSTVGTAIASFFTGIWNSIVATFANVASWFYDTLIAPVLNFFQGLWEGIVNTFHTVIDPWIEIIRRASVIVYNEIIVPVLQFFQDLWDGIVAIWQTVSGWFNENVITPVVDFFRGVWESVSGFFVNLWNDITGIFIQVASWWKNNVTDPIKNKFTDIWDGIKNGAKNAWEGIKSVFSGIADWFKNIFSTAWQKVKDVFSAGGKIFDGIKEGIVNAFKNVVNAIITGINKVITIPFTGINAALRGIKGIEILGVKPFEWINEFDIPQIPMLANGMYVPKNYGEFTAILGDNKREPEIVSPVSKMKETFENVLAENANLFKATQATYVQPATQNNSPVINLNFGGVTLSNSYDTDRFAEDIMTALGSKIASRGMEWG